MSGYNLDFYKGRRVFITGHTGFKGSWLCKILINAGAVITGYALDAPTEPSLYKIARIEDDITSVIGDIRDYSNLRYVFEEAHPEVVFHLAAQPLVRDSYRNPALTYAVNVMGTVNILECVRHSDSVKSFLNVTTDKVYKNNEWVWGYRENDELDGFDPYSNSKSCSELVTHCYKRCFFNDAGIAISTVRAGNVIGGGDFAPERIVPDCVRAAQKREAIVVRNPHSVRPYQHVLEPLFAYLMIAAQQVAKPSLAGAYNIGPDESDCIETEQLVALFVRSWGENLRWVSQHNDGPHEANFLKLDCLQLKAKFGWEPRWSIETAIARTVEWSKLWLRGGNMKQVMDKQIEAFLDYDMRILG